MGLNTALIVRNDFLHEIKDDAEFGQKVYGAIVSNGRGPYHGQSFDVLPSDHADNMQIVAIGGNIMRRLGYGGYWTATDEDILRNLADSMGFRLVRKAVK
jgi:hypothetical protein